jgi:hypothetical protein
MLPIGREAVWITVGEFKEIRQRHVYWVCKIRGAMRAPYFICANTMSIKNDS